MATILKNSSSMGMPMNIQRGNPIPLDSTEVWYSFDEAQAYARTGVTAYVGQRLSVVDETNGNVEIYIIKNVNGDLIQLSNSESSILEWGELTEVNG